MASEGAEGLKPGVYKPDPSHTIVGFEARHMVLTKVRGRFKEFDGTINIGVNPADSSAEGVIKAASIDTGIADRDNHLKSPDFLDVEKFPDIRFRSTKVVPGEANHWKVEGDLTIKDETQPVVLEVEYLGSPGSNHQGKHLIALTASTEIERESWGITWNMPLDAGGWLVSKKVKLEIETEGVLQDV